MSGEARPSLHTAHSSRPLAHRRPEEISCSLPGTWLLSRLQKPQVGTRSFFYPQGPRDSEPILISSLSFTVPLSPRVPSRGTLSRTTPLPPWDPSYQANAGSQLVVSWGICGSVSSGRGAVRERALSNFPFSTGAQPRVSGIFVWQDTLPSFLAYV